MTGIKFQLNIEVFDWSIQNWQIFQASDSGDLAAKKIKIHQLNQ